MYYILVISRDGVKIETPQLFPDEEMASEEFDKYVNSMRLIEADAVDKTHEAKGTLRIAGYDTEWVQLFEVKMFT